LRSRSSRKIANLFKGCNNHGYDLVVVGGGGDGMEVLN
jgi:hypothetical protein